VPGRLPNYVIVGAMKSGTTSLAEYLGAHPQAYTVPQKELYFFERNDLWDQGVEWYAEQFAGAAQEIAVGEASPSYMYFRKSAGRMAEAIPDAKLIAILRDPVQRALSHYMHWRFHMAREDRSFAQAIEDELATGPTPVAEDRGAGDVDFNYVGRGVYLPQLENICSHFPRESLLVLLLEDLERAPAETFAQVCRFLGLDDSIVPENVGTRMNAHHKFRPVWLWRLSVRHDLWRFVPKRYRLPLVHRMGPGTPGEGTTAEPIAPEVRARLNEYFADHNAALAEWLGRDLSAWGSARP
jgi:hypothetical protein